MWFIIFHHEKVDLSHIKWESNEDVSEDSDPMLDSESEDTTIRHSLNIYR